MTGPHSKQVVPATSGVAVVPSDVTVIDATRALYIGVSGNIVVTGVDAAEYTLLSVPIGILPVSVIGVNSTLTTATNIVALY